MLKIANPETSSRKEKEGFSRIDLKISPMIPLVNSKKKSLFQKYIRKFFFKILPIYSSGWLVSSNNLQKKNHAIFFSKIISENNCGAPLSIPSGILSMIFSRSVRCLSDQFNTKIFLRFNRLIGERSHFILFSLRR